MLFRLWNLLFGWDYVAWKNSADYGVARVFTCQATKRAYYFRYKSTRVTDIIKTKDQVIWLTCDSSKYMLDKPSEGK